MSKGRVVVSAVVAMLVMMSPAWAKMYEPPKSFALREDSLRRVDRKVLAAIDAKSLVAEERQRAKDARQPRPFRFAVSEKTSLNLQNSGTWQDVADGRIWRLVIQSPGALSLNLGITRFDLPEGAKLWVYDPGRKRVDGPYTAQHRSLHGRLWTPVIDGDEIVVELFTPSRSSAAAILIGQVGKGFRDFSKDGADKSHGACNNDVICPEGDPWRDQIRSVARYTIDGTFVCSGQLMNNVTLDFTPYFLSANHCDVDATNDDTLVFYWNYESPNCGDLGGGSLADNQTGAIFRASHAPSDFLLVELSADPDASSNVFFSGWDANGTAAASTVGIHHPSGDVKSISFNTNAVTSTAYGSDTVSAGANHWKVDDWEDGTTEGGSSGSCLWDAATKRCIGQLHGGEALCSVPDGSDWYGKLSVSWTGGGTSSTRLSDWLDPDDTGTLALDGDPHITTLDGTHYDFQGAGEFVALRASSGAEVQVRQDPIATTFNPGPNPYTGLATCVSLNSAVAARVGGRRVTYQPNLSGVPDPSGMQLRVDGTLTTLGSSGVDLGNGGRIARTSAPGGIEIAFPDNYTLFVTPGWWTSQSKWYLNVGVVRTGSTTSVAGASPSAGGITGGLAGAIPPSSWLPLLPNGSSMGPMPASLHDRYVALYEQFGKAWRVTNATTLFDYAPGTSTDTFTLASWPLENPPCVVPQVTPVQPLSLRIAQRLCRGVADKETQANCVFDVRVTGEPGFAQTYLRAQRVAAGATTIDVTASRNPTAVAEPVTFVATVSRRNRGESPAGAVQFTIDGERAGAAVPVDGKGRAIYRTTQLKAGEHKIAASYIPREESGTLSSTSGDQVHIVTRK